MNEKFQELRTVMEERLGAAARRLPLVYALILIEGLKKEAGAVQTPLFYATEAENSPSFPNVRGIKPPEGVIVMTKNSGSMERWWDFDNYVIAEPDPGDAGTDRARVIVTFSPNLEGTIDKHDPTRFAARV